MTEPFQATERRDVIAMLAALGAAGTAGFAVRSAAAGIVAGKNSRSAGGASDFDFLAGRWAVRHRRRNRRLVDDRGWTEFTGTLVNWPLLGGLGNVGDNVMNPPTGSFRGIGMRTFDAGSRQWSSWWLDGRNPTVIGNPLRGGFADGVGTFLADDVLDGRPVKNRVIWSRITADSALWEQSASADGGASWEVNWTSAFTRQG